MNIKPKRLFNEVFSLEMGFICPEYNTVRSQITRSINKQLHPDPGATTFDEIPEESEYYKTKRGVQTDKRSVIGALFGRFNK